MGNAPVLSAILSLFRKKCICSVYNLPKALPLLRIIRLAQPLFRDLHQLSEKIHALLRQPLFRSLLR